MTQSTESTKLAEESTDDVLEHMNKTCTDKINNRSDPASLEVAISVENCQNKKNDLLAIQNNNVNESSAIKQSVAPVSDAVSTATIAGITGFLVERAEANKVLAAKLTTNADSAPRLKLCSKCRQKCPKFSYTLTQWRKKDGDGRCNGCVVHPLLKVTHTTKATI